MKHCHLLVNIQSYILSNFIQLFYLKYMIMGKEVNIIIIYNNVRVKSVMHQLPVAISQVIINNYML